MDAIRVAKVDRVLLTKPSLRVEGTLHLTAHHLIFKYEDSKGEQEIWVPYPLISTVVRLPQSLHGQSPLAFRTRTFEYFILVFTTEKNAEDVFESVKELTVTSSVTHMYAFYYNPTPPLNASGGWSIYSPRDEFGRMGVGTRTKAWRFTDLNKDYAFCPTYPARLVVPAKISDAVLTYASKYRSKARIPALVYLHWNNHGSITRSSQPMVGITQSRSVQDEKLIEAIFQSHHSVLSPYASPPVVRSTSAVYGATATNLIIDARPTTNAVANTAKGAGTENMDHYKEGRKVYLGVENIHVMRDSLAKVADALRDADVMLLAPGVESLTEARSSGVLDRQALRRSGWLKHLSAILDGVLVIVKNIHINSSHVLIHCSDGWDRTAQLSSLSQLCLDPYFRTYRGFQVLIEKDWVSFGHKFADRCGHLSSEKFFLTPPAEAPDGAQAFLASVQNKFASQSHLKETSPVFHQFLECVRQIQRQYPDRFEFNERFLERLHYHLYSCQFGTFLFNNEKERRVPGEDTPRAPYLCTHSVWDYLNSESERTLFINPTYDSSLDARDAKLRTSDMGVLFPNSKDVRFWHELYGRSDEDMNGRLVTSQAVGAVSVGPLDTAADDPVMPTTPTRPVISLLSDGRPSSPAFSPANAERSRPSSPRQDTFRPFSSSSAFSLRTSEPISRSPEPTSSPLSSGLGSAAGGMRSMWAQISSNATAAFSAVQEVYDGATKELMPVQAGPSSTGGAQESDLSWGEESAWTAPVPTRTPISSSPTSSRSYLWGSSSGATPTNTIGRSPRQRLPLSLNMEDPWSSSGSPATPAELTPQPRSRSGTSLATPITQLESELEAAQLPSDPTVEPIPRLSRSTTSLSATGVWSSTGTISPWARADADPLAGGDLLSPPSSIVASASVPVSRARTPSPLPPAQLPMSASLPTVPRPITPLPAPNTFAARPAASDGKDLDPLGVGFS